MVRFQKLPSEPVKEGELLAELDKKVEQRNLALAEANLLTAEANLELTKLTYAADLKNAESEAAARAAVTTFEQTWTKRCPGVVRSLQEGGDELLTFFRFPRAQWKTLRTTNVIERLNEEFRRRVKTQGSLPTEDAAVVLLFSLVASGQIRLRRLDGWSTIVDVVRAGRRSAA